MMLGEKINSKIMLGLIFLVILMVCSFFPSILFTDKESEPIKLLYNEEGEVIGSPPFPPAQVPPFGTDKFGLDLFYMLIEGAKYTFFFVVIISLLRLVLSLGTAIIYAFYLGRLARLIRKTFDIIFFIPPVFIIFFIMGPLSNQIDNTTNLNYDLLLFQLFLFTALAVPPLTITLGEEIRSYLGRDFIRIVNNSGVSNLYIFTKHIFPLMKPRLIIIFLQQVVQLLVLLIHLGVLSIFIGGEKLVKTSMTGGAFEGISLTNEWSGLIGTSYQSLFLTPWLTVTPLMAFMLLIGAIKLITSGYEDLELNKYCRLAAPTRKEVQNSLFTSGDDFKLIEKNVKKKSN